ncbi:hypothetical protein M0802_001659 [Mischocyttarus mexicanus]|nr:hypothetical protein M0802_001659 [Mischocyttarus mexicanus]
MTAKFKILIALLLLLARSLKTLPLEDESSEKNESSEEDENRDQELSEASYRLSGIAVPIHYDIKLIPYMEGTNFTFDGETIIRLNLLNMTQTLDFHSLNLTFDNTRMYLESEDGQKYETIDLTYVNTTQIMTISFEKVIPAGIYSLYTKFTGIINDELMGFYRSSYTNNDGEKVWLVTTQFQATYARQAFPCWDEPSLKATFNVSIKHQTNYTALSNMPAYEQSTIDENDGKIWTYFQTTPIMSTYILAFVVSDFVNISNADGTINVWARNNIQPLVTFGYEVALKTSVILEKYTNSTLPIPKMDHVIIPDYRHGAMENWGLITYAESLFVHNPNTSTLQEKTMTAMIVVHELTHQWFGNAVSPSWWNHVWLSEGFASYFQYYITDKVFPSWGFIELLPFHLQLIIYKFDKIFYDQPISRNVSTPEEIEKLFGIVLYTKTPSILNMLSHIVTDEVFHKSLINYLQKNQYSNTLPDDLFNEIQIGVDETPEIQRGEFRVKEVMETWIYQGYYPLVTVKRNYVTGEATITQEVTKRLTDTNNTTDENEINNCNKWWIPINYATKTDTNFSSTLPVYWLSPKNDNITINGIDADDWIIINVQQTGHYQVNYDETNWIKLANYLNSPNYENIDVLNRVQIIQDSYSMFITDNMNLTMFLDLYNYLSREVDYIVWRSVFLIFDEHLDYLIETTEGNKLIKPYVLNLMNNLIESVGFDFVRDDNYKTQLTKSKLRNWACRLGHYKCIKAAETQMKKLLEYSDKDQYPTDLIIWVYCYGINNLNESIWNELFDIKNNNISMIIDFLSCINDEIIIEKYLNMTIAEDSPFTKQHCEAIYEALFYNQLKTKNFVTDFVLRNWDIYESRTNLLTGLTKLMIISAADKNKLQEIKIKNSMLRKLIKLLFVFVTIDAFSLQSTDHNNVGNKSDKNVYRLSTNVVPIHYDLKLELDIVIDDSNCTGELDIIIEVREETKLIKLNWKNIEINETQSYLENENNGESYLPKEHRYDLQREMLILVFDNIIQLAVYNLHLEFTSDFSEDLHGFYRFSYDNENGDKTWLAVTHFQPISARRTFPCWDEPAFKATFNISLKHCANFTALSNMPAFERSFADENEDKVWTRFERSPIMATNILAFAITDFEHISLPERNITIWARKSVIPSVRYALEVIPKIEDELKKYMGSGVIVPKIDHIAVPDYSSGASENWGLITYKERLLIYKENETTMDEMDRIVMLIAHELTHQWFGNLVGPRWWKYMWMSEGFARYFQYYITDKLFHEKRMMDIFVSETMQSAFYIDKCQHQSPMNKIVNSPSDIPTVYSFITYSKVMDTWTEQEGYPRIVVDRDYNTGIIKIRQFDVTPKEQLNEGCNNKWWIPLNFVTQANPDFSSTLPTHWLNPSENTKTIQGFPKDGWIIVNIQQTGYYRVNYDQENWKRIARYLNSNDYKNIHVLNRIQIIGDTLNSPYIRRLLNNKLNDMDYKDNPEDDSWTKKMKQVIKEIACTVDVPECFENATAQLIEYLENSESLMILPQSRNWVFCYGLRNANESVWNRVLNIYVKNQQNKTILTYLSCSYNRTILENYLAITISEDSLISKNDFYTVLEAMVFTSKISIDTLLDFINQNLNELYSKTDAMNKTLHFISFEITTREQLKKMIDIFSTKGQPLNDMILYFETKQAQIDKNVLMVQELVNATID